MIDWGKEYPQIRDEAIRYGVDPYFISSIRVAEDGPEGCEFGVKSVSAPTYADQLRETCLTVRNHMSVTALLWKRRAYPANIVHEFALMWAPPNAANDPRHLNEFWFKNCWGAYSKFCQNGLDS
jgi:hypothetical protein